jgi:exonuclease VII small subunit
MPSPDPGVNRHVVPGHQEAAVKDFLRRLTAAWPRAYSSPFVPGECRKVGKIGPKRDQRQKEKAMAQLTQAAKRLQTALDRLEQVVESRAEGADESELRSALAAARKENVALQGVADTVVARLDSTIGRLKETLEA